MTEVVERSFVEIVNAGMTHMGWSVGEHRTDENGYVLEFFKDNRPTYVSATAREIRANNHEDLMLAMIRARMKDAMQAWEEHGL